MTNVVFITGTGRCGTNILKSILSKHSEVASFPFELRFLTDTDGIIDFYSSYSECWSPYIADKKYKRLKKLLEEVTEDKLHHKMFSKFLSLFNKEGLLISPKSYVGWELKEHIPAFELHNRMLLCELSEFKYRGVYEGIKDYTTKPGLYICEWKSKQELAEIFKKYLRLMIEDYLFKHNKKYLILDETWAMFFANEILDIIPNAKFIHIYRNPKDVIASFTKQKWCPTDVEETAIWYKSMMKRIDIVKNDLNKNNYCEIELEKLIGNPRKELNKISKFIGTKFENQMLDIDLSKGNINRWKTDFTKEEVKIIDDVLCKKQ